MIIKGVSKYEARFPESCRKFELSWVEHVSIIADDNCLHNDVAGYSTNCVEISGRLKRDTARKVLKVFLAENDFRCKIICNFWGRCNFA